MPAKVDTFYMQKHRTCKVHILHFHHA